MAQITKMLEKDFKCLVFQLYTICTTYNLVVALRVTRRERYINTFSLFSNQGNPNEFATNKVSLVSKNLTTGIFYRLVIRIHFSNPLSKIMLSNYTGESYTLHRKEPALYDESKKNNFKSFKPAAAISYAITMDFLIVKPSVGIKSGPNGGEKNTCLII